MSRLALLALAASLAACSAPAAPLAFDAAHPASPQAAPSPTPAPLADLAPVAQPDLPAVLRPEPASTTDHGQTDHGQMPSMADAPSPNAAPSDAPLAGAGSADLSVVPDGVADALGAYLAVQTALAADGTDAQAAARLADALRRSTEVAPAGDPHLWHRLSAEVAAAGRPPTRSARRRPSSRRALRLGTCPSRSPPSSKPPAPATGSCATRAA